jgi:uncharacterized Ntn-hydrolase superfamily protein
MTWSIVAVDDDGSLGVAVASRAFAVGALCPYARSGVGALSTQALVNLHYAAPALDLLARGTSPAEVIATLTGPDEGRDHRQLHLVDASGRCAAYTGAKCVDWCGHRVGARYSVAGNMLAGPDVVSETARVYEASAAMPFAERLLRALAAGEAAGGDKRGKQAAALLVCTTERYPFLDLRVDDHEAPIDELRRLYEKSFERYQALLACLPSRDRPWGVTDRAEVEAAIERFQAQRARREPGR